MQLSIVVKDMIHESHDFNVSRCLLYMFLFTNIRHATYLDETNEHELFGHLSKSYNLSNKKKRFKHNVVKSVA